jgi:hypothetical protein
MSERPALIPGPRTNKNEVSDIMRSKKTQKNEESKPVLVPRLVKAADVAAREAAAVELQQVAAEKVIKPVVRTPRNAMEARDIFNSLFGEAA